MSKNQKVTLICARCKKEYAVSPSRVGKSRFCSKECRGTGITGADYQRQYREKYREVLREKDRQRAQDPIRRQNFRRWQKDWRTRLRREVFDAYGGLICTCDHNGTPCGSHPIEFLAIDHINGECKHSAREAGYKYYQRLKKAGFPPGHRVLCHNCNMALGFFGYCPHSKTETQEIRRCIDSL
jgi:tRNA/tmRNA/rRNA uracil-C5-methylase (TrmA/RlmC/RlmD family)